MNDEAQLIAELKSALQDQLARTKSGDIDDLLPSIAHVDELIKTLLAYEPTGKDDIGELHRRLRLAIADKKADVGARLAAVRKGRRAVGAYGRNSAEA
jgi:hypothetical protein